MPTLNLKKEDVLEICFVLKNSIPLYLEKDSNTMNTKMSFLVNYINRILSPVFDSILEASKTQIPEYIEFEKEKKEVLEFNAEKNKLGQPIKTKAGYLIPKNKIESVTGYIDTLKEKYKKAIEERKLEEVEIEKMLKEEISLSIPQTSFNNFPSFFTPEEMRIMRPLISESDEEILKIISA